MGPELEVYNASTKALTPQNSVTEYSYRPWRKKPKVK